MLKIKLSKRASKALDNIPVKHAGQIAARIKSLSQDTESIQSLELKGYAPWRRAKSGEYRIIYHIDGDTLNIGFIGKRNDSEIYKLVARFMK